MGLQQMLEFIYILMATALIGTCRRCQAQRACPADPDCQHSIAAMNIYYNRASLSYNELYSPTFIWVLRHTYFKTCLADGLNFKTKYKGQSDMYMCSSEPKTKLFFIWVLVNNYHIYQLHLWTTSSLFITQRLCSLFLIIKRAGWLWPL